MKHKQNKQTPAYITDALITTSPSPLCFVFVFWGDGGQDGGRGDFFFFFLKKRRVNLFEHRTLSGLS